jgi:hypothetical protein
MKKDFNTFVKQVKDAGMPQDMLKIFRKQVLGVLFINTRIPLDGLFGMLFGW